MKKFIAVFWRGNPEYKNGGYKTRIQIEAKSKEAATKKASKIRVTYDTMTLLQVYEEC